MPERQAVAGVGDRAAPRRRPRGWGILVLRGGQPGGPRRPARRPRAWPRVDGRRPEYLLGSRRQPFHPGQQQVGQAGGQRGAGGGARTGDGTASDAAARDGPAGAGGVGQQFLGVVGVALGPADQAVQVRGRDQAGGQHGQVLGHGGRVQRAEVHGGDAGQPQQLGHDRPQRMHAAVHVVGAVGGDQGDPLPVQHPAEEGDQVTGGAVGPVQVLEHEQYGGGLGQLSQQAKHRSEQLLLHQARQVAGLRWAAGRAAAGIAPAGRPGRRPPRRGRTGR